jgi:hypothetical protein
VSGVALSFERSFRLKTLQFNVRMISESHRGGDRAMPSDLADRLVHQLADTAV